MSSSQIDAERVSKKRKLASDLFTQTYLNSIRKNPSKLREFIESIKDAIQEAEVKGDVKNAVRLSILLGQAMIFLENNMIASPRFSSTRIADIEHEISSKNTSMKYTFDLERFSEKIDEIFDWYKDEKKDYVAPYFPLIQSSGMGKTKVMFEYKSKVNKDNGSNIQCFLLSCEASKESWEKKKEEKKNNGTPTIFDHAFIVPASSGEDKMKEINIYLDELLATTDVGKKVVLCIDEAQSLVQDEAFPLLCIRWWLRRTNLCRQVVAVFTGTTTQLAHFYKEMQSTGTSRDPSNQYHEDGKRLYKPFYELCTTGILAGRLPSKSGASPPNDLVRALEYGRPLFVTLDWKETSMVNMERRILAICERMLLLAKTDKVWTLNSHFSVLGTRVQFGQTHFNLASKLVSNGYAILSSFDPESHGKVARICFQPDPVCAQIAMSLMTKDFHLQQQSPEARFTGKEPKYWTKKATELITQGLGVTDKGDVGEIAGALYLLFCGDFFRFRKDKTLKTFSVDLSRWIEKLMNPEESSFSEDIEDVQISFIQVCTNHLRHPLFFLSQQKVFEEWYTAGVAFYGCEQSVGFDLIAPICIQPMANDKLKKPFYCPLLVQFKNRISFSEKDQSHACDSLENILNNSKDKIGLGIVLLLGQESPISEKERMNGSIYRSEKMAEVQNWCKQVRKKKAGSILTFCIAVPPSDCFGINDFAATTTIGNAIEIYESCSIINQIAKCVAIDDDNLRSFIRSKSAKADLNFFLGMHESFVKSNEEIKK